MKNAQPVIPGATTYLPELSDQQFKILYYSVLGFKAKDVAEKLDIAINTVYAHKQDISHRLRLGSRQWRQFALEQGVIIEGSGNG